MAARSPAPVAASPAMIPPKEAARRYGIARTTLSDWARAGLIGRFKQGRTVRLNAADIEAVLAAGTTRRTEKPRPPMTLAPTEEPEWVSRFWGTAPVATRGDG